MCCKQLLLMLLLDMSGKQTVAWEGRLTPHASPALALYSFACRRVSQAFELKMMAGCSGCDCACSQLEPTLVIGVWYWCLYNNASVWTHECLRLLDGLCAWHEPFSSLQLKLLWHLCSQILH